MSATNDAIVGKLNDMHPTWDIRIDAPPDGPAAGAIRQPGGSGLIRYVYAHDDRGRYLEFYSFHRIWGDSHARIYDSGEVVWLRVLETATFPTGDVDQDRRQVEEQNHRNQELLKQLDEAGLLSGGPVPGSFEINAAIATGLIDPSRGDA